MAHSKTRRSHAILPCLLLAVIPLGFALPQGDVTIVTTTASSTIVTVIVTETPRASSSSSSAAPTTLHVPGSFPTTLTYVTSTTLNSDTTGILNEDGDAYWANVETVVTATTVDAWPETVTDFPLEHVLTISYTTVARTSSAAVENAETTAETSSSTASATYALWKPIDVVEYLEENGPTCGEGEEERPEDWQADSTCENLGLETACNRQCDRLGGLYWCYEHDLEDLLGGSDVVMGRTCWGNGTKYLQLNEPCYAGDVKTGCLPGVGEDPDWQWDGEDP